MKTIVQASSPAALLQSRSFTLTRSHARSKWQSQAPFVPGMLSHADLHSPWEHAVWILLGVVSAMLLLLTFGLD